MLDAPKTLAQARKSRYDQWPGNPKGWPYKEGRCAYAVHDTYHFRQCSHKNGHGPGDLYCKQHSKMV